MKLSISIGRLVGRIVGTIIGTFARYLLGAWLLLGVVLPWFNIHLSLNFGQYLLIALTAWFILPHHTDIEIEE